MVRLRGSPKAMRTVGHSYGWPWSLFWRGLSAAGLLPARLRPTIPAAEGNVESDACLAGFRYPYERRLRLGAITTSPGGPGNDEDSLTTETIRAGAPKRSETKRRIGSSNHVGAGQWFPRTMSTIQPGHPRRGSGRRLGLSLSGGLSPMALT